MLDFYNDVLELTDGTPVSFLRESIFPWVRWRYSCMLHTSGGNLVHQFDYQGNSRDAKTLKLRKARDYRRWDLYTLSRGFVSTFHEPFTRKLEAFEYVIERHVDLVNGEVTVNLHQP